jgi:hypothetical protein
VQATDYVLVGSEHDQDHQPQAAHMCLQRAKAEEEAVDPVSGHTEALQGNRGTELAESLKKNVYKLDVLS